MKFLQKVFELLDESEEKDNIVEVPGFTAEGLKTKVTPNIDSNIEFVSESSEKKESIGHMYEILSTNYDEGLAQKEVKKVISMFALTKLKKKNALANVIHKKNQSVLYQIGLKFLVPVHLLSFGSSSFKIEKNISLEEMSKNYSGTKCCYIPVFKENELVGKYGKFVEVYLKPATTKELEDLLDILMRNIQSVSVDDSVRKYKENLVLNLYMLLSGFAASELYREPSIESRVYSMLADLFRVNIKKSTRHKITMPESPTPEDEDYIRMVTDECRKVLRVRLKDDSQIQTLFSTKEVIISGFENFYIEEEK